MPQPAGREGQRRPVARYQRRPPQGRRERPRHRTGRSRKERAHQSCPLLRSRSPNASPAWRGQEACSDSRKKHWAWQPVPKPAVPEVNPESFRGWPKTPIDNFILAKLEEKELKPNPPADKRTLIRRATFDLIGLPPTAEEVDAFVKDESPEAFAKVVDRLLASPHYGERWR